MVGQGREPCLVWRIVLQVRYGLWAVVGVRAWVHVWVGMWMGGERGSRVPLPCLGKAGGDPLCMPSGEAGDPVPCYFLQGARAACVGDIG
jgi:hypothetical protein